MVFQNFREIRILQLFLELMELVQARGLNAQEIWTEAMLCVCQKQA